ncbi:DUF3078 domain-containing protein [Paludibacter sp. 221]|uniref:DUF3078 domain-containing protein n=1 Tax=Paludibacter sp. 221 TaxID=2302939 RepID=UPI0013D072C1|nr:DUF3078 domain-containing protein [Paludibacter sp. 221]NDV45576.1 DUF3078 domain-containing protein [Paludibacter sp. 221]
MNVKIKTIEIMKSKKAILLGLILVLAFPIAAQITSTDAQLRSQESKAAEDGWHAGGVTTVNFSQLYLSNWAAGGENSYSLNGLVSLFASYKKNSLTWDNTLDMGYGFVNQYQSQGYRKTDDKFEFNSKVGYKAFSDFYYSGLLNFKTQFDKGYDYKADPEALNPISKFLAPAYLTAALGLSYQPNRYFSALIAPVTGRMTIVNDENLSSIGAFGVDPGSKTRMEFGGYIRTIYSKNDFKPEFLKNVTLTSKLDLFSNYLDNPQYIDVNWEVLISLKVNRFLSVNLNTNLVYDYDVKFADPDGGEPKDKVQFKELLGVGFSLNF